ncbi:hypothetical protein [Chitinophaga sp.]|uniref:hypothetical protein n=1 Tax=Chitinophaga sp. TaxID=1869181 RepID=UPI002F940F61
MQNDLESYQHGARLIVKYWENKLSAEESEALEAWIAGSEENRLLFAELTKEATLKEELKQMDRFHPQKAWKNIEAARRERKQVPWAGVVATLIMLLLAITLKWCYLREAPPADKKMNNRGMGG